MEVVESVTRMSTPIRTLLETTHTKQSTLIHLLVDIKQPIARHTQLVAKPIRVATNMETLLVLAAVGFLCAGFTGAAWAIILPFIILGGIVLIAKVAGVK
jgi:hypothetical protein